MFVIGSLYYSESSMQTESADRSEPTAQLAIPIAVLGDSDSHSYQDTVLLTPDRRGGPEYRATTLQWTEILQRLRPNELEFGKWGVWGTGKYIAALRRQLGLPYRWPAKADYEYNFAISGAGCDSLTQWLSKQVAPLTSLLTQNRTYWERGVVVIRIGINDLGTQEQIARIAADGLDSTSGQIIDHCIDRIRTVVETIRDTHKEVGVALLGIFEEPDAEPLKAYSAMEIANIRAVNANFNEQLGALAAATDRTIFIEDQSWWKLRWGTRDEYGKFHARAVNLGGERSVENSRGNHPANAILEDGHAGTVVNAFFARHLVEQLNSGFGLALTSLRDDEIARLIDPDGHLGLSPYSSGPE